MSSLFDSFLSRAITDSVNATEWRLCPRCAERLEFYDACPCGWDELDDFCEKHGTRMRQFPDGHLECSDCRYDFEEDRWRER